MSGWSTCYGIDKAKKKKVCLSFLRAQLYKLPFYHIFFLLQKDQGQKKVGQKRNKIENPRSAQGFVTKKKSAQGFVTKKKKRLGFCL